MDAIGCESVGPGSDNTNEVIVPLRGGGVATFDCGGAPRSAVREAVIRYTTSTNPSADPRFPSAQTWYINVTVHYQCEVTHHWTYVPVMGEYVYSYSTVDGCWITEIHHSGSGGGGGGGSWEGPQGEPVPAPSPPESPPIVADTICVDSTADRFLVFRPDSAIVQGPLNDMAMQDSLRAAHFDSYGTIANPLVHSQRLEIGGIIYQAVKGGPLIFHRVPSIDPSPCRYGMDTSQLPSPRFRDVATFHTHTMRDGETFMCPHSADTVWEAVNEASGGGLEHDWNYATLSGRPLYTIDPDRIWRLEPDTPVGQRYANPQRWTKGTAGTCAPVAPF